VKVKKRNANPMNAIVVVGNAFKLGMHMRRRCKEGAMGNKYQYKQI
jgi:hypothetical protein